MLSLIVGRHPEHAPLLERDRTISSRRHLMAECLDGENLTKIKNLISLIRKTKRLIPCRKAGTVDEATMLPAPPFANWYGPCSCGCSSAPTEVELLEECKSATTQSVGNFFKVCLNNIKSTSINGLAYL